MLLTPNTFIRILLTDLESSCLDASITLTEIAAFYGRFCNFFQNCNKVDDDQIRILVKCTLRYIQCVNNLVDRLDVLKNLEIRALQQYISVVSDIPYLEGIKDTFMKLVSNPILEKITYTRIKPFVSKELVKHFNLALQRINRELRSTIAESSKVYLCKLVTMICTCGDYDYQTSSLEIIFRLCTKDQINKFAVAFFPNSTIHQSEFLLITTQDFDKDIRVFLNLINKEFKSVFSFKCHRVLLGDINIIPPQNSDDILWVDFNMGSNTITIICKKECVRNTSSPENDDWEIILTKVPDIGKAQMSNLVMVNSSESVGSVIIFNLKTACTFKYSTVSRALEARILEIAILKCPELKQLQELVLPKLLNERFEVLSSSWLEDTIAVKKAEDIINKAYIFSNTARKSKKREYKPLHVTVAKPHKRLKTSLWENNGYSEEKIKVHIAQKSIVKTSTNNTTNDISSNLQLNPSLNNEPACAPNLEKIYDELDIEVENIFDAVDSIEDIIYERKESVESNDVNMPTKSNNRLIDMRDGLPNSNELIWLQSDTISIAKSSKKCIRSVNDDVNVDMELTLQDENVAVMYNNNLPDELNNSTENNEFVVFDEYINMQSTSKSTTPKSGELQTSEYSSFGVSQFSDSYFSVSTTDDNLEKDSRKASTCTIKNSGDKDLILKVIQQVDLEKEEALKINDFDTANNELENIFTEQKQELLQTYNSQEMVSDENQLIHQNVPQDTAPRNYKKSLILKENENTNISQFQTNVNENVSAVRKDYKLKCSVSYTNSKNKLIENLTSTMNIGLTCNRTSPIEYETSNLTAIINDDLQENPLQIMESATDEKCLPKQPSHENLEKKEIVNQNITQTSTSDNSNDVNLADYSNLDESPVQSSKEENKLNIKEVLNNSLTSKKDDDNDQYVMHISVGMKMKRKLVKKMLNEECIINEVDAEIRESCLTDCAIVDIQTKLNEVSDVPELNITQNKSCYTDNNLSNVSERNRTNQELYSTSLSPNTTESDHTENYSRKKFTKKVKRSKQIRHNLQNVHHKENAEPKYRRLCNLDEFLYFVNRNNENKDFDIKDIYPDVQAPQSKNGTSNQLVSNKLTNITNSTKFLNNDNTHKEGPITVTFEQQRVKQLMEKTKHKISDAKQSKKLTKNKNNSKKSSVKKQKGLMVGNKKLFKRKQRRSTAEVDNLEESLHNLDRTLDNEDRRIKQTNFKDSTIHKKLHWINVENSPQCGRQTRSKTTVSKNNKSDKNSNQNNIDNSSQQVTKSTCAQPPIELHKNNDMLKQTSFDIKKTLVKNKISKVHSSPLSVGTNFKSSNDIKNCTISKVPKKLKKPKNKRAKKISDVLCANSNEIVSTKETDTENAIEVINSLQKSTNCDILNISHDKHLENNEHTILSNNAHKMLDSELIGEQQTIINHVNNVCNDSLGQEQIATNSTSFEQNHLEKEPCVNARDKIDHKVIPKYNQENKQDSVNNTLDSSSISANSLESIAKISSITKHADKLINNNLVSRKNMANHGLDHNLKLTDSNIESKKKQIDIKQIVIIKSATDLQENVEMQLVSTEHQQKDYEETAVNGNTFCNSNFSSRRKLENSVTSCVNSMPALNFNEKDIITNVTEKKSKFFSSANLKEFLKNTEPEVETSHEVLQNTLEEGNITDQVQFQHCESEIKSMKLNNSVVEGNSTSANKSQRTKIHIHDRTNLLKSALPSSTVPHERFNHFDALKENQSPNKHADSRRLFKVPKPVQWQTRKKHSSEYESKLEITNSAESSDNCEKQKHSTKQAENKFTFNSWLNSLSLSFKSTNSDISYGSFNKTQKGYVNDKKSVSKNLNGTTHTYKATERPESIDNESRNERIETETFDTIKNGTVNNGTNIDTDDVNINYTNTQYKSKEYVRKVQKRYYWTKILKRYVNLTLKHHTEVYGLLLEMMKNSETNFVQQYKTISSLNKKLLGYTKK